MATAQPSTGPSGWEVRQATSADEAGVSALAEQYLLAGSTPNIDGDETVGTCTLVVDHEDRIAGYVTYAWAQAHGVRSVTITAIAVVDDLHRLGIGAALLDAARRTTRSHAPSVQVSINVPCTNDALLGVTTQVGFRGTGPLVETARSSHVHCVWSAARYESQHSVSVVPVGHDPRAVLGDHLGAGELLTGVIEFPHGPHFEFRSVADADDSAFMATEVAVGAGFAGALLAAIVFLFGFALVSRQVPGDVLGAIGACVAFTTLSMVAYANGSGELSRIREGTFDQTMTTANILSEFAGVYPMFIFTPAIAVAASSGSAAAGVFAVASGAALLLYMRLGIDLLRRYAHAGVRAWVLYRWALAAAPIAAFGCWHLFGTYWPWTVLVSVLPVGGAVACSRVGQEVVASPAD